ncbi:DUF58 domain-containing protein [Actinomycetes bacterium NPDC127524]
MRKILQKLGFYMKIPSLLFIAAASFAFAMFQGGFVSWFLFYTFLPFAVYPILLFFYPMKDFSAERLVSRTECIAGENIEISIRITRSSRFPLCYLLVEEKLPSKLSSGGKSAKAIVFPLFKKEIALHYSFENMIRGEYHLQEIRVRTGDIFGFFEKEESFELRQKLLVLPAYYELPYRQIENFFDQGLAGTTKKLQRENSVVSGIREYQQGDQLSWINWKATARMNKIMTKEFEEQKNHDVFIILDEEATYFFEELVSFTASFAHSVLKKGIQIGFLGTNDENILPVRGGDIQQQKILYKLAKAEGGPSAASVRVFDMNKALLPPNAVLVYITSDLTEASIELLESYKRNMAAAVFCLKKDSFITEYENRLRHAAFKRGIKVSFMEHSHLEEGLSGVIAQ